MPSFTWPTDTKDAEREQLSLRELVKLNTTLPGSLDFERGLAVGTAYDENTKRAFSVAIPFSGAGKYLGKPIEADLEVDFPYIPGLLAFRVGPAICSILDELIDQIDLLLLDGQGIAHPRTFGLASHIGVLYDKPSIGVTRKNLYGTCINPPRGRFFSSEISHPKIGTTIGHALSLGEQCDPCYVSPGHRVAPQDAVAIVRRIAGENTCFPRPLKRVHANANAAAKKYWRLHAH